MVTEAVPARLSVWVTKTGMNRVPWTAQGVRVWVFLWIRRLLATAPKLFCAKGNRAVQYAVQVLGALDTGGEVKHEPPGPVGEGRLTVEVLLKDHLPLELRHNGSLAQEVADVR